MTLGKISFKIIYNIRAYPHGKKWHISHNLLLSPYRCYYNMFMSEVKTEEKSYIFIITNSVSNCKGETIQTW